MQQKKPIFGNSFGTHMMIAKKKMWKEFSIWVFIGDEEVGTNRPSGKGASGG